MAIFHLLKIRSSIEIFKNEKCKVTFGLEYIISSFREAVNPKIDTNPKGVKLAQICLEYMSLNI